MRGFGVTKFLTRLRSEYDVVKGPIFIESKVPFLYEVYFMIQRLSTASSPTSTPFSDRSAYAASGEGRCEPVVRGRGRGDLRDEAVVKVVVEDMEQKVYSLRFVESYN